MADMAPALTGAAQEAPHRLKLSAPTTAWKARSGLLLLNGKAAREDAPGPGRGMRRSLRGPNSAPGPRTRPAPGPTTLKDGPGPQNSAPGPPARPAPASTTPNQGPGPQNSAPGPPARPAPGPTALKDVPGPQDKPCVSAPGSPAPQDRRTEGAPGPTTPKHGPGPQNSAPGPPARSAPGPTTPKQDLKLQNSAPGPPARSAPRASAPRDSALGPTTPRQGPEPLDKQCVSAPGPTTLKDGPGLQDKRVDIAAGPAAAHDLQKDVPGPQVRRLAGAPGPAAAQERRRGVSGPLDKRMEGAPGPPARPAPEASSPQDSATCPSVSAPGPIPTQERRKDGLCPPEKRMEGAPGPTAAQERREVKRLDSAPGPVTPGNAKGHLAGQDLAPEPTGRAEAVSGPPAVKPNPSQGCVPDSHAPGSSALQAPASGPVDSQDVASGPRVLCSLRAAQMSGRQQELGVRARRLCRRLQVIQAKQVERHVRQQLSGLVEMLSERGAAGLPGSPHIELDRLACSSTARLRAAQGGFDSDATESSSGGESDEEETTGESSGPEREEEEQRREPRCDRHDEWRWAVERAAIICRWTWLQAQVSDLEFRIRQQTEIYKQIRSTKGGVVLGDSPQEDSAARQTAGSSLVLNARGNRVPSSCSKPPAKAPSGDDPCDRLSNTPNPSQSSDKQCSRLTQSVENVACQNPPTTPVCDSPGSQKTSRQVNGLINCVRSSASCNGSAEDSEEVLGKKRRVDPLSTSPALSDSTCVAARTRPLRGHKKRSLVRSSDVSSLSRKPQKPLSTKCGCDPPTTCILCGCKTYARTSHPSTMALNERISLMDPCYHPILSFPYDTPIHLHFEALLKDDRQFRASNKLKILKLSQLGKKPQDAARSMFRDDRQYKGVPGPSIQVFSPVTPRPNLAAHQLSSINDTPPSASQQNSTSAALKRKRFENSYDIDNIVIPMSLVAASRVEKLQYKEILTPSWRVLDSAEKDVLDVDPQLEDLSDDAYQDRHSKNEDLERSRWDSWTSAVPQRRGSRSCNRSEGRWTPQTPNSQGSSQQMASPYHSLNDIPLSLSSAAADYSEPYSNVQCLSVHSRSRVLSWSEDTRSSTPEIPDDEEQVILPWEPRSFPLSDRDCRSLKNSPGTPSRGRTKPHPDVPWQTPNKPGAWTESVDSGMSTENLTPASKEPPLPNSISVVRVRAHSGDKIASLEYFPPRPVNKR